MGNGESSCDVLEAERFVEKLGKSWSRAKFDAIKGEDGRVKLPLNPDHFDILNGPEPTSGSHVKAKDTEMPVHHVTTKELWMNHVYEESNPFLLFEERQGAAHDPPRDDRHGNHRYATEWHLHMGMCVLTYVREGKGRFADSLGNAFLFDPPGVAWWNCGGGLEHAQGGGDPKGALEHSFEIWVIAPHQRRYDNPSGGCASASLLALGPDDAEQKGRSGTAGVGATATSGGGSSSAKGKMPSEAVAAPTEQSSSGGPLIHRFDLGVHDDGMGRKPNGHGWLVSATWAWSRAMWREEQHW